MNQYLISFHFPSGEQESDYLFYQRRTCYSSNYPFKYFPYKGLKDLDFGPITIIYGGNGSGKSTILNIIAEKLNVTRHSVFNGSGYFKPYVSMCSYDSRTLPGEMQILTSDDVFDYMLNVRYINDGIDFRREELFDSWLEKRKDGDIRFKSLDDYDNWKEVYDSKTKTQSQFVRERLMRNVDMHSNGENAMKYFTDHISENALYLLDEPENSLSYSLQKELTKYISDSARHFGCQFIIATHSPILLSISDSIIYDLDETPVKTKKWTELENVKLLFDFFEEKRSEFTNK